MAEADRIMHRTDDLLEPFGVEVRCVFHPTYAGKKEPRVECEACEMVYRAAGARARAEALSDVWKLEIRVQTPGSPGVARVFKRQRQFWEGDKLTHHLGSVIREMADEIGREAKQHAKTQAHA